MIIINILLKIYRHIHTHTHIYIYIYIYIVVDLIINNNVAKIRVKMHIKNIHIFIF